MKWLILLTLILSSTVASAGVYFEGETEKGELCSYRMDDNGYISMMFPNVATIGFQVAFSLPLTDGLSTGHDTTSYLQSEKYINGTYSFASFMRNFDGRMVPFMIVDIVADSYFENPSVAVLQLGDSQLTGKVEEHKCLFN